MRSWVFASPQPQTPADSTIDTSTLVANHREEDIALRAPWHFTDRLLNIAERADCESTFGRFRKEGQIEKISSRSVPLGTSGRPKKSRPGCAAY
jgi:hypothetical protein